MRKEEQTGMITSEEQIGGFVDRGKRTLSLRY